MYYIGGNGECLTPSNEFTYSRCQVLLIVALSDR